jgi:hypothetical protein
MYLLPNCGGSTLSIKLRYHLPVIVELFLGTDVGAAQENSSLACFEMLLRIEMNLAGLSD